ncbi:MAG TPA: hypothetical protein DDZ67_04225 [Xanthomonadaceae bacterium]|nr:hypothetical protein [Xanthomonadaceae bacterium]
MKTVTPLIAALCLALAGTASAQSTAAATSEPLRDVPANVRTQPLASGAVTHEARVQVPAGEAAVTVRSIQPNSVSGNYRIDFQALDSDGDGFISRDEAQANPALADEFDSLDTRRTGRLSREQLAGWLVD